MQLQNDFHMLTRQRLNHGIQMDVGHHLDLNEPRLQLGFLGLNQPLIFSFTVDCGRCGREGVEGHREGCFTNQIKKKLCNVVCAKMVLTMHISSG